jgi:acyl dehydratase
VSEAGVQQWGIAKLDQWSEPVEFAVETERTIAYAQATNDEHPKHLSGELAPPVFAFVVVFEALLPAIASVVPQEHLMRVVHGEHDFRYHRPIVPGQTLRYRLAPVGIHGRSSGVAVIIKALTETPAGEPVTEQHMTAFFRGAQLDRSEGEQAPAHAFPERLRGAEPVLAVEHAYDADQTQRYSKASGDPMPIHLDEQFARSVGLPGIIVHGMCTLAFASQAVIQASCPEDPSRLKRLAGRFSAIVLPSEKVTTSVYDAGRGAYAFETATDSGKTAIKDGLAEVAG